MSRQAAPASNEAHAPGTWNEGPPQESVPPNERSVASQTVRLGA